eukprot:TRINITY_DN2282_c0_g1_i1.p1 TRINITY_DN2282_c0_g1~~TRINITY_DN2282_c0_g1_i1.p1  ORF type:complete len:288 (-),score=59.28 TRINITY_DN2282_c0_g1_i1:11-874(-)
MTRVGADLSLDTAIRDWVLIPIVAVMFVVAIFRHYTTKLLQTHKKPEFKQIVEAQMFLRARRLKMNHNKIPHSSFLMRKHFFGNKENGLFRERPVPQNSDPLANMTNPMTNPMMDPSNMVDMMKKNMAMIVPQMFLMTWVSYFFSGFVLVKLPFPLSFSFKTMLQRGIDLTTLDVSYVSSLSWYFLTLFGLRGLNSIILGEANAADDAQMMQDQFGGMGGAAPAATPADLNKIFQSERENLELIKHEYDIDAAERKLVIDTAQPDPNTPIGKVTGVDLRTRTVKKNQ